MNEEKYAEALKHMELLAADFPYDYRNRSNMAILYLRTGETEKAIETFKLMLEIVPGDRTASYSLARIFDDRKDYNTVETYLLDYANGFESSAEAYLMLAHNALMAQRKGDSRRYLQEGLEKFPQNEPLKVMLSQIK